VIEAQYEYTEGGEETDAKKAAPQEGGLKVLYRKHLGNSRGQKAGGVASDQLGLSSGG
jgi:hypothetical protein